MGRLLLSIKLAWRNVLRNKRRTLLAGLAVGIGLAALIFSDALMIGMGHNMIASATSSFLGEGQVHRRGFRATGDVHLWINGIDEVVAALENDSVVTHFAERVVTAGMIASASNATAISLVGIDPAAEPDLSQVDEAIEAGEYLTGEGDREILIGSDLADLLDVGLGDRLVVTAARAGTGDLGQQMFRVSGVFRFQVRELDRQMAFVPIDVAREMLSLGRNAHEIAVRFVSTDIGRNEHHPFFSRYSQDGNEAVGWTELLPQLEKALELSRFSTWLVGVLLFGVVSLGIVNALFMSLYERMFEFGVMRAIGTHPAGMARLIVLEAASLAVISCGIGGLLGLAVVALTGVVGIDYTGIEFAGVTFRRLLYPVLRTEQFTLYPLSVFLFTLVVSLYPALFAARLKPAEAMRRSL
jgi:ABC-type lipoprotein release transport system permease subunit